MSLQVSPAIQPISPVAAAQAATPTKELNPIKSVIGAPESPVKYTMPDKSIQPSPALPAMHGHAESSPLSLRHESTPANSATTSSLKPVLDTETVKGDSASQAKSNKASSASVANANKKDAENLKPDTTTPEDQAKETALTGEIADLWSRQKGKYTSLSRNRRELEQLRSKLGESLAEYHNLLARSGRDGKWMPFLREAEIPKTTAERLVKKWKLSTMPKLVNRTTGTIQAPSKEEIEKIVKKLKVKVERVLTTPESVTLFLTELAAALQPLHPVS
jgi:hypothetical protein